MTKTAAPDIFSAAILPALQATTWKAWIGFFYTSFQYLATVLHPKECPHECYSCVQVTPLLQNYMILFWLYWASMLLGIRKREIVWRGLSCHAHLISHWATVPCYRWHKSVIQAFGKKLDKYLSGIFPITMPGSLQESLQGRFKRLHLWGLLFWRLCQGNLLKFERLINCWWMRQSPEPPSNAETLSSYLAEQQNWTWKQSKLLALVQPPPKYCWWNLRAGQWWQNLLEVSPSYLLAAPPLPNLP